MNSNTLSRVRTWSAQNCSSDSWFLAVCYSVTNQRLWQISLRRSEDGLRTVWGQSEDGLSTVWGRFSTAQIEKKNTIFLYVCTKISLIFRDESFLLSSGTQGDQRTRFKVGMIWVKEMNHLSLYTIFRFAISTSQISTQKDLL